MTIQDILNQRLDNQQLLSTSFSTPEQIVRWFGAVQSQDYMGRLWGIGQRIPGSTIHDVERAIEERKIVRTWPMRGTIHFVAAEDVHWMLSLLTPKFKGKIDARYRELGITADTVAKSQELFHTHLSGGKELSRSGMYDLLERNGISTNGQRGIHLIVRAARDSLICHGPKNGKETTFVLLDEWVPKPREVNRDEALQKIARKYFQSHGPATLQDFAWWTGLNLTEVKKSIESIKSKLDSIELDDKTYLFVPSKPPTKDRNSRAYLLPNYDEYIVAYKERSALFDTEHTSKLDARGNFLFNHTIIMGGVVVGTWRRMIKKDSMVIQTTLFREITKHEQQSLQESADNFGRFWGMKAIINT